MKYYALLIASAVLMQMKVAGAFGLDDLWQRRDQQAHAALQADLPERALRLAADPWQRGTAAYRTGDYHSAVEAFRQVPGAVGHYNAGNALVQLGEYENALAAYDAALAERPNMEDAQFNRELVAKMLEQQQNQPQQNQTRGEQQRQQSDSESQSSQAGDQGQQGEQNEQQPSPQNQFSAQTDETEQQDDQAEPGQENQGKTEPQDTQASDAGEPGEDSAQQPQLAEAQADPLDEERRQVMEQWLRRIPDDPRGLLRRKFMYQYQRLAKPPPPGAETW